jgi:hypothetical protein
MSADSAHKLIASAPVLRVRDVVAAAKHYRDAMGFSYERFFGEPPVFVIVERDDMYLMLKRVSDAVIINPHRMAGVESCDVYFWTSGVDALHDEFVRRGAKITDGLHLEDYGCKEFAVEDIDGYEIRFGRIIAEDRAV